MPLNTTFYHHMGIYPTWVVSTSKNTAKMGLVAYPRRESRPTVACADLKTPRGDN
jgi:hypothetical protein